MEKIYMEENKSQNNSQKGMYRFSIVLSFAVAIFAMVTLGMVGIVINQGTGVSYAAPVTGDNFTLKYGDVFRIKARDGSTSSTFQMINYYYNSKDNEANRVYCIERKLDAAPDGQQYTYTEDKRTEDNYPDLKDDGGLVYLLNIDTTSNFSGIVEWDDDSPKIQGAIVQAAIWKYLAAKYPNVESFKLKTGDAEIMNIEGVLIEVPNADNTGVAASYGIPHFKSTIDNLVSKANAATAPTVTVSKESDAISLTEDEKYYQSAAISVVGSPSSNFTGYDAALAGIDGAFAVDENGNELTLTNVNASKKFYIRIPAEKVTKTVQKVTVNVTGHFDKAKVVYYVNSDATKQRMGSVAPTNKNGGEEVEFVGTDDTGMNTAQTIYFIGLIVLLCGVGIVYANARPVESKQ